jgi:transposase
MVQPLQEDRSTGNLFWLTDARMARLEPFFPKGSCKPRVDDRRLPSGIVFINRKGVQRCDAPWGIWPGEDLFRLMV